MSRKRGVFTLLSVAIVGACLGLTSRTFASEFIPPEAESEGYTGHSHEEPDGGWYCHCGSNPDCKPCGGADET